MKLGDFQTRIDNAPPYTLYDDTTEGQISVQKPTRTSWRPLQAWTYPTSDCSGPASSYKRVDIHLVPKTYVNRTIGPIHAEYIGTNATTAPTIQQTSAIVKATRSFVDQSLYFGYFYHITIWSWHLQCWRLNTTTATTDLSSLAPLQISYKMRVTLRMQPVLGP